MNRIHTPDIVILLETKNKSSRYSFLKKKLNLEFMHVVEPRGIGGGLCVMWRDASQVVWIKSREFMIEAEIWDECKQSAWHLFAIYASTDEKKRRDQWMSLSQRISRVGERCLLIGDFNDILSNDEKEGGKYRSVASLRDFREFVARNDLMDLGYEGYPFTWRNNRDLGPIQQRLDRGLASMGWQQLYPDTKIRHMVLEGSDHAMLGLTTEKDRIWKGKRFMYEERWSKQPECRELVGEVWQVNYNGSHGYRLSEKLKTLGKSLKVWYKGRARNSKQAIDRLKGEIRSAYMSNNFATTEVQLKEKELREAHKEEESFWRSKSRVQWLKEGDKNTKFFHAQTIKRRRYNQIRGVEDADGIWREGQSEVASIAVRYFSTLFQAGLPCQLEHIVDCMEPRVTLEDNQMLIGPITDREIQEAAFQIPASRAPGPDGFPGSFYHDHWEVVGQDVVNMIKAFWHSGKLLRNLNHTNLALIPKVACPKNMKQFRPIALCNVGYKILAKVLTNRLKRVMPNVICDNQSAFVAGKQIQDNILVVHEILHSLMHQSKADTMGMAIKLDMAKAYDRVEWDFLLAMMSKLGFDQRFCDRIKECISTVSLSILLNGNPTGYIKPQRGLRQGDPLSPYLFLLCTEGFSALLRTGLEHGTLHGIRVSPTGRPISHLFFADDSVLFCNASAEDARGVSDILRTYAAGSGQEINLTKSSIMFSPKTKKRVKKEIVHILNIQCRDGFGKYLGLQADFGMSKKAVFEEVRERIESRMAGWAEQFLSQAGKEILIKAVAMAMPNYAMSCFKLPIGVCKDIEKAVRNYWWRGSGCKKGIHWVAWEKLRSQKRNGGIGFKDFQCFNLALLAKIGWRITLQPDSLLANVLREKYFPGKTFGEANGGRGTSWGWKGILEARKVLVRGIRWRVGDGTCINIRKDPWFPKPSTFKARVNEGLQASMVSDLIDPENREWKIDIVNGGFLKEDVSSILSIPLSKHGMSDRLVWHYSKNGEYTVRTGYGIAMGLMENGDLGKKGRGMPSSASSLTHVWNKIWKLEVPNKMKFFIWKCCNNALAVRRNLKRRNMRVDNICEGCMQPDETENHLFFRCEISHIFWFCSPLQLNSFELEGTDFLASWGSFCGRVKGKENEMELMQEFLFGLWRLWKNRNDLIFKGVSHHPLDILGLWTRNLGEFRAAGTQRTTSTQPNAGQPSLVLARRSGLWRKPGFGTIKVNTDAAWHKETLLAGVGWVARDFAGLLQAAGGSGGRLCHSAAAAEMVAIRSALEFCVRCGLSSVAIESDAKNIIQMLRNETTPDFSLECIFGDIVTLARGLESITYEFVSRESNRAAHSVARYVFQEGKDFVWDHIGPEFLFNILAQDIRL
ncbi:unnamed protein product [Malus baccata var. baccata]